MKPTVLVPERIAAAGMDLLQAECRCLAPWINGGKPGETELREMLSTADAVLIRLHPMRAADIASASRLKVIARHGVGVDNVDVAAATARGIPVVFTPMANANAVAEQTMTLMLALARHVYPASAAVREGRFRERDKFVGVELAGKTLGVMGLGRIGSRVAEMARHGFGMDVRGYDPFVKQESYSGAAALEDSLESLLGKADFLTLHLPLTADTTRLINAERLRQLKPGCRLINTSRGGVIDEMALAQALHEGRLAGAALDVYEQEPLPADHPFLRTPNTLLTPHISSSTKESLDRMARDAAQGVLDVLAGKRPQWLVNPESLR